MAHGSYHVENVFKINIVNAKLVINFELISLSC